MTTPPWHRNTSTSLQFSLPLELRARLSTKASMEASKASKVLESLGLMYVNNVNVASLPKKISENGSTNSFLNWFCLHKIGCCRQLVGVSQRKIGRWTEIDHRCDDIEWNAHCRHISGGFHYMDHDLWGLVNSLMICHPKNGWSGDVACHLWNHCE